MFVAVDSVFALSSDILDAMDDEGVEVFEEGDVPPLPRPTACSSQSAPSDRVYAQRGDRLWTVDLNLNDNTQRLTRMRWVTCDPHERWVLRVLSNVQQSSMPTSLGGRV